MADLAARSNLADEVANFSSYFWPPWSSVADAFRCIEQAAQRRYCLAVGVSPRDEKRIAFAAATRRYWWSAAAARLGLFRQLIPWADAHG
jgi:hypothetical protein